ncbi:delayed-rectifier potassium channel regulatory subunit KCNS2-like isoform X1 [Stigmatopora argus]
MVTKRRQGARESLVRVNVGGLRRTLRCGTLTKFPDTRLGKLLDCRSEEDVLQVCDDYDAQRQEFYFDRNPGLFRYVLHFYRTGKLHVTEQHCVFSFSQEMEYWGIGDFFLDSCCRFRYHERKMGSRRRASWDDDDDEERLDGRDYLRDDVRRLHAELRHLARLPYGAARQRLWLTLENPGYSLPGKVFSAVAVGVLLASLAATCVESVPDYQTLDGDGKALRDPAVDAVEAFSTCWFTLEVALRFLSAPDRKRFFLQPLNAIDAASVLPVYVTLLCDWTLGARSERGLTGRVLQVPAALPPPLASFLLLVLPPSLSLALFHPPAHFCPGLLLPWRLGGVPPLAGLPGAEAGPTLHGTALAGGHPEAQLPGGGHPAALPGRGRVRLFRHGLHRRVPGSRGIGHHPGMLVVGHGEHDHGGLRRRRAGDGGRQAGGRRLHPGRHPVGGAAHRAHLQQVLPLLPAPDGAGGVRPTPRRWGGRPPGRRRQPGVPGRGRRPLGDTLKIPNLQ